jgi:predicted dehydrogenase
MSRKVGIGIIGLDHWYWALGCAYNTAINPDAELIAISDQDEEKVKRISKVYGAKMWYTDYQRLLENPEIDAIIVTTMTSLHPKVVIAATKAGKDVLVGKPIARTLEEADQILRASKKAGVKLMAMAAGPLPGDPVKKLIDEGAIGKPFAAHYSLLAILPLREPGVMEPGWFVEPEKAAGGGFIDHAVYGIALLRGYFGSEVRRVYAEMGKFVHEEFDVEDYGLAIVRFRDSSIATLEASFTASVQTHSSTIIIGTEGEIEIKGNTIFIWSKKEPYKNRMSLELLPPNPVYAKTYVEIPVPIPPFAEVYKPTVDEFIRCIVEDREPLLTGKDARAVLEVCLAAYESVRVGKPVTLPLKTKINVPDVVANL